MVLFLNTMEPSGTMTLVERRPQTISIVVLISTVYVNIEPFNLVTFILTVMLNVPLTNGFTLIRPVISSTDIVLAKGILDVTK